MAAITIKSDFGAPKNKVWHCFHCFPIYFPWRDGTRCHNLHFLMLSFKPAFLLSSFTFIKRPFSSCSLSAIRVVSSAYLRLLIFLLAILIPAVFLPVQRFSWCTLHRSYISRWQYTALTHSFSYLEPVCCSMSSSNCCFLTWIRISQEAGQVVWYSHLFQNYPQFLVIHTI